MQPANLDTGADLSSLREFRTFNTAHQQPSHDLPGIPDIWDNESGSAKSRGKSSNSQSRSDGLSGTEYRSRSNDLSCHSFPHSPRSPNIQDGDDSNSYSNSDGESEDGESSHNHRTPGQKQDETSGEGTVSNVSNVSNDRSASENADEQDALDQEDSDDKQQESVTVTALASEAWKKENPPSLPTPLPAQQSRPKSSKTSKTEIPPNVNSQKESFERIFMRVSDDDTNLLQALQDAKRKFSVAREGAMSDLFADLFDRLDVDHSGSIEINGELLNSMDRLGQPIVLTDLRIAMEKVIVRKCDRMQKENMFQNRPVWDAMYKEEFVQVPSTCRHFLHTCTGMHACMHACMHTYVYKTIHLYMYKTSFT
jgi:hypothetical protein